MYGGGEEQQEEEEEEEVEDMAEEGQENENVEW